MCRTFMVVLAGFGSLVSIAACGGGAQTEGTIAPATTVAPEVFRAIDGLVELYGGEEQCVADIVTPLASDVLVILNDLIVNGNPTDHWPDGRALGALRASQAC